MIISHKHKFVFVHNPKVAGTSIRKAFANLHDDDQTFWHQGWSESESRVIDLAHLTADTWPALVPETYTVFGFVREPYARFLSGLREVMRRHSGELFGTSRPSFSVVLDFVLSSALSPANIRYDWRYIHLCPQHHFFYVGAKCKADKVCAVENLEREWTGLQSLLGLQVDLPHERRSSSDDLLDALLTHPQVVGKINSLYLRDFQLFGYNMHGTVPTNLYSERIAVIHDPARKAHMMSRDISHIPFTDGELRSLRSIWGRPLIDGERTR